MIQQRWRPVVAVLLLLPGAAAIAQGVSPKSSELAAFMGRWVFTMANPLSSPGQLSLETLVSGWYEREFGETIPRPAIFNDDRAVDRRRDGHLTTHY